MVIHRVKISDDQIRDFDFELYENTGVGGMKEHPETFTIEEFSSALSIAQLVKDYMTKFNKKEFKVTEKDI